VKKTLLTFSTLIFFLFAGDVSQAKIMQLSQKGEKIAQSFCDIDKLPQAKGTIDQQMEKIRDSQACSPLSKRKLEAVAYYLSTPSMQSEKKHLHVPGDAKCPVCGMFVAKYPKWAASITINETTYYFDGVKDMMKYYIFDKNFIYARSAISQILVGDYYTLEAMDAREAFYVVDSNVYGPMGRELIPFRTLQKAETFMQEHKGKKVVRFNEVTAKMLMALDGIE